METTNETDFIDEIRSTYHPEQRVEETDGSEALRMERTLTEKGYRMIGGMAVFSGTNFTVERALREIDHSRRYENAIAKDTSIVVGPCYEQISGNDFCPPGIAVWKAIQEQR